MNTRILQLIMSAAIFCGSIAFPQGIAAQTTVSAFGEIHPTINLLREGKGIEIPGLIGNKMADLAKFHRRSAPELSCVLERDASIRLSKTGHLYYACKAATVNAGATPAGAPAKAPPFPVGQTFTLHSLPGAAKVIYLDFKGHTTTGTEWNKQFGKVVTPPYDIDGNPSSFSTTELTNIQLIWQSIAEDYSPFEVDVTTQDPGVAGIVKANANDLNYGIRVCFGGSYNDWLHDGAGGVSFLNTFGSNTDTPCFVFVDGTGTGSKGPAEAGAHELGHTFGLSHQGQTNGTEYYHGQGDWAPIMGSGYNKPIVQWSQGEYPLANNKEDATAMIASYVPFRTDTVGGTISAALPLAGSVINVKGLISQRTDIDVFRFVSGAGDVTFTLDCASPSPDISAQMTIFDGSGTVVKSVDLGTNISVPLTATLAKRGTYYISIDGVGSGSASATGYSDYACLGQYTLKGTVIAVRGGGIPPTAVATSSTPLIGAVPLTVNFSSAGSSDPDGSVTQYYWVFGDGTTSILPNPSHTYTKPGIYPVTLVVYDNGGFSGSTKITVNALTVDPPNVHVGDIKLTLSKSWWYGFYVKAQVLVVDQAGAPSPSSTVTASWSGPVTGTVSGTTDAGGALTLWSDPALSDRSYLSSNGAGKILTDAEFKRGTFTFEITDIARTNFPYTPGLNTKTTDTVTTP